MKKRWGKPITQVQRFVPQEYARVCCQNNDGKIYKLIGTHASGSGGSKYNNLYVDWYKDNTSNSFDGKYNNYREDTWFSKTDYTGELFTEAELNSNSHLVQYTVYQGPSSAPPPGTDYSATNGFTIYTDQFFIDYP